MAFRLSVCLHSQKSIEAKRRQRQSKFKSATQRYCGICTSNTPHPPPLPPWRHRVPKHVERTVPNVPYPARTEAFAKIFSVPDTWWFHFCHCVWVQLCECVCVCMGVPCCVSVCVRVSCVVCCVRNEDWQLNVFSLTSNRCLCWLISPWCRNSMATPPKWA